MDTKFKSKDITGNKYGRLVAIKPLEIKGTNTVWLCQCECGNMHKVAIDLLNSGKTKSCGCLHKETASELGKNTSSDLNSKNVVESTNINNITRQTLLRNNKSGITGVYWDKSRNKWMAQIEFQKKHYNLGRYSNIDDAIKARKEAEKMLFGEFLEWYNNKE